MMTLFIVLLYSFVDICYSIDNFFATPIDKMGRSFAIRPTFKEYGKSMALSVDLQGDHSVIAEKFNKREYFNNFTVKGSIEVEEKEKRIKAEILMSDIIFPKWDITGKNFMIYYGDFESDVLSLSYNSKKRKDSLINNLYDSKLINRYMFSFIKRDDSDMLYFGNPLEELKNKKNKGYCRIRENKWMCRMINVYMNNKAVNKKYKAIFDTNVLGFLIPKTLFYFFDEMFFNAMMNKKRCIYDNMYGHNFYLCDCGVMKDFPEISFGIGNYVYTLTAEDLFFHFEDFCVFSGEVHNVDDTVVLGTYFINQFDMEFNFETKEITLSANRDIIKENEKENEINEEETQYIIMCTTIILLFCESLYLIFIKNKII